MTTGQAWFGVMAATPRHTYQILTKRPARMVEWFRWVAGLEVDPWTECHAFALALDGDGDPIHRRSDETHGRPWPLFNVWLGVSVENQAAADERISLLLQTPAAVRFLSCEPLLGPVDLRPWLVSVTRCQECSTGDADTSAPARCIMCSGGARGPDWIIAGCESGPGARPCEVAWLRSLRDQCKAADVPFFLKQAAEEREVCDECGRVVRYWIDDSGAAHGNASCGCTVEGAEGCDLSRTIAAGPGSHRKAGGVIELPYLDGRQHAAFPATEPTP